MQAGGKARRGYSSPLREEAALRTRRRIVSAATRLFVAHGYAGTTFDAVALEAGVARPTVVTAFANKAALLSRVLDEALAGDDEPVPVRDRPWFQPVWEATTAEAALTAYAHVCRVIGGRAGAVVEALHRASDSGPDTAALWERWLAGRRAGAAMVVERDVVTSALRSNLTVASATDVLWTLNNPDLFVSLVGRQRWRPDRFEQWLAQTMCGLLLEASDGDTRRGDVDGPQD